MDLISLLGLQNVLNLISCRDTITLVGLSLQIDKGDMFFMLMYPEHFTNKLTISILPPLRSFVFQKLCKPLIFFEIYESDFTSPKFVVEILEIGRISIKIRDT